MEEIAKDDLNGPATSTPEKLNGKFKLDLSEVSKNVVNLTPKGDHNSPGYQDKKYPDPVMNVPNQGDTFYSESLNRLRMLDQSTNYHIDKNDIEDHDLTPLFKKLPSNKFQISSSTPINEKVVGDPNYKEIKFSKGTRNIFNLSPDIETMKTNVNISSISSSNPVKCAFNVFDKKNVSFSSRNSSFASKCLHKPRKRPKKSENSSFSDMFETHTSTQERNHLATSYSQSQKINTTGINSSTSHSFNGNKISFYEFVQSLVSDPERIANFTLILQVTLNVILVLIFLGFGAFAFIAIKRDVDRKISIYVSDVLHQINSCRREYLRNNCAPEMRVPALEYKCNQWDACMEQDPESVITSMAYFEVLADCMNAFFHNITLKSLLGIGCLTLFCVVAPNIIFSKFRSTTINSAQYTPERINSDEILAVKQGPNKPPLHTPISESDRIHDAGNSNVASNRKQLTGTSVRFNPNISYSFYDLDNDEKNQSDLKNEIVESEEEDDSLPGNQRILMGA